MQTDGTNSDNSQNKIKQLLEKVLVRFDAIENKVDQLSQQVTAKSILLPTTTGTIRVTSSYSTPKDSHNNNVMSTSSSSFNEVVEEENFCVKKEESFLKDQNFHRMKWLKSKNEDYEDIWKSDEHWIKAAEATFIELFNLRSRSSKINCLTKYNNYFNKYSQDTFAKRWQPFACVCAR